MEKAHASVKYWHFLENNLIHNPKKQESRRISKR